ncbi:disease resistance protein RPP2B-like [Hibiscus syriacus]|uniref:disease resistance protein RPP2B-like n=1 Tax=Hibiscus syriacus TaxID=106335 RepID=UPI00192179C8|nr:disease resistance protein RPP2B-like [Hibiscus syriacus]
MNPAAGFRDLSYEFLKYAQGNPHALKVLGSQLHKKSRKDWESELDMQKEYPQPEISKLLKTSFLGLDDLEKNIFLDTAIFFNGEPKEDVEAILSSCYKGAKRGIGNLIDKCLVEIIPSQRISMRDMLEEMGKDIIHKEPKIPGMRKTLWSSKDVVQVLKYNKGTESIEGIKLDMSQIEIDNIHPTFFENMLNLRYIQFYHPRYYFTKSWNKKLLPTDLILCIYLMR